MIIRDCVAPDFDMVLPLLEQLWPDMEPAAAATRRTFLACLEAGEQELVCAVEGERIVGVLTMSFKDSLWRQGTSAYIDVLVVEELFRGKGVGAALLGRAEDISASRGCYWIELDSFFHREGAHSFYEKQGYEKAGYLFCRRLEESA